MISAFTGSWRLASRLCAALSARALIERSRSLACRGLAGMLVAATKETQWVHHHLEPFRTVFLALFFVSVGMLVNLDFVFMHWCKLGLLVLVILLVKTIMNGAVLRWLGYSLRDGMYAGACWLKLVNSASYWRL